MTKPPRSTRPVLARDVGQPGGVAGLDEDGNVIGSEIPAVAVVTARQIVEVVGQSLPADGSDNYVVWDPDTSTLIGTEDSFLDFTDPVNPVFVRGGTYAVHVWVKLPATADEFAMLDLSVYDEGYESEVYSYSAWPLIQHGAFAFSYSSVSRTWRVEADDSYLNAHVLHTNDTALNLADGYLELQAISLDPT